MQRVVADCVGGGHAFFDVARIEPILVHRTPDPGIAIGLEFELYRQRIAFALARTALRALDFFGCAEQVLDVVAEFMRHHIIGGKIALRAEAIGEFIEETRVEINALIAGAIKWPHRGLRSTTARAA